jgi:putative ABC transport system ATP-binding protein
MGTLDRPTTGEVRVAGYDAARAGDRQLAALRAREIGFVFQQFFLIEGMPAVDNVANGLLYSGVSLRRRRRAAAEALARVWLSHRLSHEPAKMSGGERQRVAIARALIARPSLVLADEPTGNLDSANSDQLVELLRELNAQGTTIVVITHDREIAASFPRTVSLRDGRVVHDSAIVAA